MIIFVQNYKKIVDSSIISILVAVFVGFVIRLKVKTTENQSITDWFSSLYAVKHLAYIAKYPHFWGEIRAESLQQGNEFEKT